MKARFTFGLFVGLIFLTINSFAQETTFTTSAANTVASKSTIDMPGLTNNPDAIIVATPLGNTATSNPNPIGAWFYNNKWNVFNTNHANMPIGATFKVQAFLTPDANHFLHIINKQNLIGGVTYIDNPSLNNNPKAQITIFQNHAPDNRSAFLNKYDTQTEYDAIAGKWFIKNVGGESLNPNTAYNVVIVSGGRSSSEQKAVAIPELTVTPKTLMPNTSAGGDLNGNYPNPNVVGLSGSPLSNKTPVIGDILRWNGTAWEPAAINNSNVNAEGDLSGTYPNPTVQKINGRPVSNSVPTVGQVLKWNGTAWEPSADNVTPANTTSPGSVNKPTFLYFTQTTGAEAIVDSNKLTAPISGLDNKFFTLSQNSRIIIHLSAWIIRTDSSIFGGGSSVGYLRVEILSNTSNNYLAYASSTVNLFPNVGESTNAVGFGTLSAGTYYTRVTIGRQLATDPGLRSGMSDKLIIEIFPD